MEIEQINKELEELRNTELIISSQSAVNNYHTNKILFRIEQLEKQKKTKN